MIRGHVFSEQIFSVDVFALFVNQFLGGNNGIVESYKNAMEMTNTANSITIKSGVAVVQGRYIEEHTETILNYAKSDSLYCSLVIEIDLGKTNTKTLLEQVKYKILEGENDYPTLIQNDIANQEGTIYQFELARFQNGATGIVNFTDRRSYLSFDSIYSGIIQDNLNSDSATSALSAKQGKILNDKIEKGKNIITVGITNEFRTEGGGSYKRVNGFTTVHKIGNKLSLNNAGNAVVIGAGVSKVKVSAKLGWYTDEGSIKYAWLHRTGYGIAWSTINVPSGAYASDTIPEIPVDVQEGQEIYLEIYSDMPASLTDSNRTLLTVEVVE